MIRIENANTVKSLRDQLLSLINAGNGDSGFPILRTDEEGQRMVGYIGANELEHALSTYIASVLYNEVLTWPGRHRGGQRGRAYLISYY